MGLEAAGFHTLFANDIDPYSCATLQKGGREAKKRGLPFLNDAVVHCGDVSQLEAGFIKAATGIENGEFDLMAGGPPCQAFSVFGNRKGTQDPRGLLVFEYIRLLGELKPRAFVFENVYGLMTVEGGSVFKKTLAALSKPSSGVKYKVSVFRLNSSSFGVPQFRDRIFVVGSKEGIATNEPDPITGEAEDNLLGENLLPFRTVSQALVGLPHVGETFPGNFWRSWREIWTKSLKRMWPCEKRSGGWGRSWAGSCSVPFFRIFRGRSPCPWGVRFCNERVVIGSFTICGCSFTRALNCTGTAGKRFGEGEHGMSQPFMSIGFSSCWRKFFGRSLIVSGPCTRCWWKGSAGCHE